jgi:hypothetical protein
MQTAFSSTSADIPGAGRFANVVSSATTASMSPLLTPTGKNTTNRHSSYRLRTLSAAHSAMCRKKGAHLVRSYGLFHFNCREKLNLARNLLGQRAYEPEAKLPSALELLKRMFPDQEIVFCVLIAKRSFVPFSYTVATALRF